MRMVTACLLMTHANRAAARSLLCQRDPQCDEEAQARRVALRWTCCTFRHHEVNKRRAIKADVVQGLLLCLHWDTEKTLQTAEAGKNW